MEKKNEIHVEYLLLPSEIRKANEASVSRLNLICKMLPIFEKYCADKVSPTIEVISAYKTPDNAHKEITIKNLILTFHKEFSVLWNNTIQSNYECDSVFSWLEHWFSIRKMIVDFYKKANFLLYKILAQKPTNSLASEVATLMIEIRKQLLKTAKYPYEDRPFVEKQKPPEGFDKIKNCYFQSIDNFCIQFLGLVRREEKETRLAVVNLRKAQSCLNEMQTFFQRITDEHKTLQKLHRDLSIQEAINAQDLLITCLFYKENQPSKQCNKYKVKMWYNQHNAARMKQAEQALSALASEYYAIFPVTDYFDEVLRFYPIIVHNLNTTDGNELLNFLHKCIPFAELDYNYLIVATRNNYGTIEPSGLRIPKVVLEKIKEFFDTNDAALADQITPPFPEDITSKILECFENKYEILEAVSSGYEGIDRIAELLWAFSKARETLTKDMDEEYLELTVNDLESLITERLEWHKGKISSIEYDALQKLCTSVLQGDIFDDASFNSFFNTLVEKVQGLSAENL